MKRIIKFRGKDIETDNWVFGDLIHLAKVSIIYHGSQKDYEITNRTDIAIELLDDEISVVNPETVGQFSLFYDKNGKEIYEDDILKFYHNNKEFVCVVGWNNKVGAWCIRFKDEVILGTRPLGEWLCDYLMEKNGNIHDNPKLLEGGSDEE